MKKHLLNYYKTRVLPKFYIDEREAPPILIINQESYIVDTTIQDLNFSYFCEIKKKESCKFILNDCEDCIDYICKLLEKQGLIQEKF